MSRVAFCGTIALFFSLFTLLPLTVGANAATTEQSTSTQTEQYLNQSLDTPLASGSEESSPEVTADLGSESSGPTMGWFFFKVILGLGVILGGIWLISKFLEQSGMAGTGNEVMGVRSTLALGQNQYLQIVQVGSQYFMLGVTENNVSKLGEITNSETIDSLELDEEQRSEQDGPRSFGEIVTNLMGTNDHDFKGKKTSDFLDDLTNRVSQLNDEASPNQ